MINQQIYKYSLNCKGLVWTLDIEVKKKITSVIVLFSDLTFYRTEFYKKLINICSIQYIKLKT